MRIAFPRVDGVKLARGFVRRKASRAVGEMLNKLGKDGLAWLIDHDIPLSDVACLSKYDSDTIPHVVELMEQRMEQLKEISEVVCIEYKRAAGAYRWVADTMTDDDLWSIIPEWAQRLTKDGNGNIWWQKQVAWLRELFGGSDG